MSVCVWGGGVREGLSATHAAVVELRHGLVAARAGRLRLGAQHAAQHGHRLHIPQQQVVRDADRREQSTVRAATQQSGPSIAAGKATYWQTRTAHG